MDPRRASTGLGTSSPSLRTFFMYKGVKKKNTNKEKYIRKIQF